MPYIRFLLCVLLGAAPSLALAGNSSSVRSTASSVQLTATLHESLGIVSATPAAALSLLPAPNAGANQPLTITTSWNLEQNHTRALVHAFLSDSDGLSATSDPGSANRTPTGSGMLTTFAASSDLLALDGGSVRGPSSNVFPFDPWQQVACVRLWGARSGLSGFALAGDSVPAPQGSHRVLYLIAQAF